MKRLLVFALAAFPLIAADTAAVTPPSIPADKLVTYWRVMAGAQEQAKELEASYTAQQKAIQDNLRKFSDELERQRKDIQATVCGSNFALDPVTMECRVRQASPAAASATK